jgi:DNA-binding response OmpR family regulator
MQLQMIVIAESSEVAPLLRQALDQDKFDLTFLHGFATARKMLLECRPDLILMDVSHWDSTVEALLVDLHKYRSTRSCRKIVLVTDSEAGDKTLALDAGADDFLLKSISAREFAARLKAALRSYVSFHVWEDLCVGALRLRRRTREVVVGDRIQKLSPTEFNLLEFLMENSGKVFAREELLENLWLPSVDVVTTRIVDVYVCHLREKIEDSSSEPTWLITRRGHGYSLVDPMSSASRHEA